MHFLKTNSFVENKILTFLLNILCEKNALVSNDNHLTLHVFILFC